MDFCVYEPFLQGYGTPIRCRSFYEVEQLIEDMCALFPEASTRLNKLKSHFGTDAYQLEIVYRFCLSSNGTLRSNFCTYEYYKKEGYQIVEFYDILAEYGNDGADDWELEDFSILLT